MKYIVIIAEDFNYDLLKVLKNKFFDVFTDQFKMVNKPIHISGSLIEQVCIEKTLMKEFLTNTFIGNIYFHMMML